MELKETWSRRTVLFSGNFHFKENLNWRCFEQPAPELLICWQLIISFSWFRFRSVSSSMIRVSNDRCCLWGQWVFMLLPLLLSDSVLSHCGLYTWGSVRQGHHQLPDSSCGLPQSLSDTLSEAAFTESYWVTLWLSPTDQNVVPVKEEFNPACKSFFVSVEG